MDVFCAGRLGENDALKDEVLSTEELGMLISSYLAY